MRCGDRICSPKTYRLLVVLRWGVLSINKSRLKFTLKRTNALKNCSLNDILNGGYELFLTTKEKMAFQYFDM